MFFNNSECFGLEKDIVLPNCNKIKIYKFNKDILDEDMMDEWARGFKRNYITEENEEELYKGTGLTKQQYLEKMVFPNNKSSIGNSLMAGEFGELLVYDYFNFVLKYYTSRTRYLEKTVSYDAIKGIDVICYNIKNIQIPSENDSLVIAEVKTHSSKKGNCKNTVQNAIIDSNKAIVDSNNEMARISESLNAEKRRLINKQRFEEAKIVERFQNKLDNPYILDFFAVAVLESKVYSEDIVIEEVKKYIPKNNIPINMLVIHSKELNSLIKELYRRACIC